MRSFGDSKPQPGDIVLVRGTGPVLVWTHPTTSTFLARAGVMMPGAVGLVIAASSEAVSRFHAYVLFSCPCIVGWVADGSLRKVTL